jgi:hypothetical protein
LLWNTSGHSHELHNDNGTIINLLRDIPPLRSVPHMLEAALYNHARLALLRNGSPLELELEKLGIDMVLEKSYWVGYHYMQLSLPLIAWESFDHLRNALDAPVGCTMHLYHHHSWLQMPKILSALDEELRLRLAAT